MSLGDYLWIAAVVLVIALLLWVLYPGDRKDDYDEEPEEVPPQDPKALATMDANEVLQEVPEGVRMAVDPKEPT